MAKMHRLFAAEVAESGSARGRSGCAYRLEVTGRQALLSRNRPVSRAIARMLLP